MRWLRTVATRRLISAARPQMGVTPSDLAEIVLAGHAANAAAADPDDPDTTARPHDQPPRIRPSPLCFRAIGA